MILRSFEESILEGKPLLLSYRIYSVEELKGKLKNLGVGGPKILHCSIRIYHSREGIDFIIEAVWLVKESIKEVESSVTR